RNRHAHGAGSRARELPAAVARNVGRSSESRPQRKRMSAVFQPRCAAREKLLMNSRLTQSQRIVRATRANSPPAMGEPSRHSELERLADVIGADPIVAGQIGDRA